MRKRSKYRPRQILANPLGYVLESITPVIQQRGVMLDLKIKNHGALAALVQGWATKKDMYDLVAASNMTEAMWELGFGREYQNVCVEGRYALLSIVQRAADKEKLLATGPEITMLNTMMELHDAQLEVVTLRDMEKALALVVSKMKHGHDTVKMPNLPEAIT